MFSNAILATFSYFDVGVIAIAVISLLLGLGRGLEKSLRGITNFLIIVIGALCLVQVISAEIMESSLGDTLIEFFENILKDLGTAFSGELSTTGGTVTVLSNGEWVSLSAALGSKFSVIAPVAEKLVLKIVPEASGNVTLAGVLAPNIATFVVALASFIVFTIVFSIILKVFRRALKKRSDNGPKKAKKGSFDRILGAVWTLIGGAAFILLVFAVIHFLDGTEFITPVINTIKDTAISSQIYAHNPLYDILVKLFFQ
ncbi:MAG: hypothetical protein LBT55_05050 [Clostridiaceae bacterium]|jgi:hypothetical protein|nr:hypothetical protein [Clostridiaceae bacterium]